MNNFALILSHDEALVFFEWLSSLEERVDSTIYDEAEQNVVWKIEGQLEKGLPDVVMEDYRERVTAAKLRVALPKAE